MAEVLERRKVPVCDRFNMLVGGLTGVVTSATCLRRTVYHSLELQMYVNQNSLVNQLIMKTRATNSNPPVSTKYSCALQFTATSSTHTGSFFRARVPILLIAAAFIEPAARAAVWVRLS